MELPSPTALSDMLSKVGLEEYYPNKLTLCSLLEINKDSIYVNRPSLPKDVPWYFLRNLLQINADCRGCIQLPDTESENDDPFSLDLYTEENNDNKVNTLDLIVALFLCADSFLQQEMALKMSMCQFSVPLLLPHCNNSQCSLMLWALRDIVKEWRTPELSESKGFEEASIVQADAPFYCFVRLKNNSLSKSLLLNHVMNHGQQNTKIFMDREMEGDTHHREIANGLVEISCYLPSGGRTNDIFQKPVIFANLRGDICESPTQFAFLYQVSTAVFVLMDKIQEDELKILMSLHDAKSKLFFVFNQNKNAIEDIMSVKTAVEELGLPKNHLVPKKQKVNVADFSKTLCATIKTSLEHVTSWMSIANMTDKAIKLGLSVDEQRSAAQQKAAESIREGIGVRSIPDYKKQQLRLQGENWKKLSKLEKEECRLKDAGDSGLEHYKSKLRKEKQEIRKEQSQYKLSKAMKIFIDSLSTSDKENRDFFLKWMKLKLDSHSRIKLSELRNQLKREQEKKNVERVAELDQTLLDSSLGIEHFMREMGLIYEFSQATTEEISRLPQLAAEMVMDGHPLELLDGDASNIPEKWVSAVLNEVHKKVGNRSRLLVLTVLGVQSSGKSTLLNTMFGVQFPVSSGRCTRGAYMIFLRVSEDYKSELNYDFLVLIDTEGLKSPQMAQLEDSYEHDNQLATFVIGLSDITIINLTMENSTEMKDILQIAVHAFLRMKEVGKKPVCHFVHQNVGAVSAPSKGMIDRKLLLDQLNEMTQIASEMEKQSTIKQFTDVLDYDMEKNNWYIPGLWHGTPPMAPVNTGYSQTVAEVKNNLLKSDEEYKSMDESFIPDFLEWMKSLWKAVKYENFIFSFRNTLEANAYDNLWKEFSEWEWDFRRQILTWMTEAKVEIHNANTETDLDLFNLVGSKKDELLKNIETQQKQMTKKLLGYYKRKDVHAYLIEKYRNYFLNNIKSLATDVQYSTSHKLDCAGELHKSSKMVQDLHRQSKRLIETQVGDLLKKCRETELSEEELTDEFNKMWAKATENMIDLKEQDISDQVKHLLKKSFSNRNVSEDFQKIGDLKETEESNVKAKTKHQKTAQKFHLFQKKDHKVLDIFQNTGDQKETKESNFKARSKHLTTVQKFNIFQKKSIKRDLQEAADALIESCKQDVLEIMRRNSDYNELYTKDLLDKINLSLDQNFKHYNITFELDLKVHICSFALTKFTEKHKTFLAVNSPINQLEKCKNQYLSDFIDQYKQSKDKTGQSQQKASDFVKLCLRPAMEDFINRTLGIAIVDEILENRDSKEYSSPSSFSYNIQKELLQKDEFEDFIKYISNYELYIKNVIFQHIQQKMSEDKTLIKLKNKRLQIIVGKVIEAIKNASKDGEEVLLPEDTEDITKFICRMQKYLVKDLSFSVEAEKNTLFPTEIKCQVFVDSLLTFVNELKEQLQEEFTGSEDVADTINKLLIKPQDELFRRVVGCGRQCPFCKVPCDAGGKEHLKHQAAVHRPQGLGGFRYEHNGKLVETLCTTDVCSKRRFRNVHTKDKWHPYKDYKKIYPEWKIQPDSTTEASDYWKYVLAKYNDHFAKLFKASPADVPEDWKNITKEQALKDFGDAFNISELRGNSTN